MSRDALPVRISLPPPEFYTLALYSVRYALHRQTYSVAEVCELVGRYAPVLSREQCRRIRDEVVDETVRAERMGTTVGADFDHKEWKRLVETLDALVDD